MGMIESHVVTATHVIESGNQRVVLLIVAHADDVALFLGGTVAAWAAAGWRVVVVRVTDDRWDSVGLSEADTIVANTAEFRSREGAECDGEDSCAGGRAD